MRQSAVIAGGVLWAVSACALAQAPPLQPSASMRGPLTMVQFQVISGRVVVTARQPGRTSTSQSTSSGRSERLKVMLTGAEPQLDYDLTTPGMRLSIFVAGKSRITVRRESRDDPAVMPLEFTQENDGPLHLAWGAEPARQERRAASLWHLCLTEPAIAAHLLPLLEMLRQNWGLADTADKIVEELCQNAHQRAPPPRQHWAALVAELGSKHFARRQAADRELRAAGQTARSFLEGYDRSQLDAEQRHRVRAILASLTKRSENDSAEGVATWLAADPLVWISLLSSDVAARRKVAAEQLARLLETPIDFDPEAPRKTREAQVKRLRARIEGAGEAKE